MPDAQPMPSSTRPGGVRTSGWRWLWLALLVIGLDQLTKHFIQAALQPGEMRPYTSFFALILTFNTGAAFSFLANAQGWQRWLFTAIAVGAGIIMLVLLRRGGTPLYCAGLALILGGALGNAIDRIVLGKVVDFLLFHYQGWSWPAFNVADSAITGGAIALIMDSFRMRQPPRFEESA